MFNHLEIYDRFKFYQNEGIGSGSGEGDETPEPEIDPIKGEETLPEEEEIEEEDKDKGKDKKEDKELEGLTRTDFKQLKADFPELFKKHPGLKEAFFREQQFTEMFPTVEDAQKAIDAQIAYEEITDSVIQGNAEKFISELETADKNGVKSFASAFLPALQKSNKDLYLDIISPVVAQMIKNVYEEGKKQTDEKIKKNIMSAAQIVRQTIFGGDYGDIEKEDLSLIDRERSGKKEDDKEVNTRLAQQHGILVKEVSDACYGLLDKEIDKGLGDLKDKPGLKKMLVKQIRDEVLGKMDEDKNYLGRMDSLWKREQRNGFSGTLKSSFTTTFLGKAKTIIPAVRSTLRKQVLGKEESNEENKEGTRLDSGSRSSGGKIAIDKLKEAGKKSGARGVFDAD